MKLCYSSRSRTNMISTVESSIYCKNDDLVYLCG